MTKAMAIQLIHYYREEHLKMYTTRGCPPLIFEERSYKRSEAVELARFIRNGKGDPYTAVAVFKNKRSADARNTRCEQLKRAYQCGKELASDILEIMEAMEDEYEYERMGFCGA